MPVMADDGVQGDGMHGRRLNYWFGGGNNLINQAS